MHQPFQLGLSCPWVRGFLVGEGHAAAACPTLPEPRAAGHSHKQNAAIPHFPPSWGSHVQLMKSWLRQLEKLSLMGLVRQLRRHFPHDPSSLFLLLHKDVVLLIAEESLIFIKCNS